MTEKFIEVIGGRIRENRTGPVDPEFPENTPDQGSNLLVILGFNMSVNNI
jgi:hypothetical protein